MIPDGALPPEVTAVNGPFWAGSAAGELRLQRCSSCGTVRHPAAQRCPACLSPDYRWEAMSGDAVLWSWTVLHRAPVPAYAGRVPYLVAYVRLREGPYMITHLRGDLTELSVGMPLRIVFEPAGADRAVPVAAVVQ